MGDLYYAILTEDCAFSQLLKRRRGKKAIYARFPPGTLVLVEARWSEWICVPLAESQWECRIFALNTGSGLPFRRLSPLEELALESA